MGDIVLVHSTSFLAKGIQVFMNISRWLHLEFKPFYHTTITNHAGMGNVNNEIIEAVAKGFLSEEINQAYSKNKGTTLSVYRYPWTAAQKENLKATYARLQGHPYQFTNFLSYIVNIFTFGLVWFDYGKSVSDKVYCSEGDATAIYFATALGMSINPHDAATHKYFKRYWRTSPYKIEQWCKKYCELVNVYKL